MTAMSSFALPERYQAIKVLGKGAYGVVLAADDTQTGERVAIKRIPNAFASRTEGKRTLRDIRIVSQLNHENIIPLIDILPPQSFEDFTDVYTVIELMDIDLHQLIKDPHPISEDHIQYFMFQLLKGLSYLHQHKIAHRDLKPSNVLVNKDCTLKICDFGLAKPISESSDVLQTEYVSTRWYRAPEIILTSRFYTESVDIWSVGCIFVEMFTRSTLFPGRDYLHQLHLVIDRIGTPSDDSLKLIDNEKAYKYVRTLKSTNSEESWKDWFIHRNVSIPDDAIDLISKMIVFDPSKRITAAEALAHPYFDSLDLEAPPAINVDPDSPPVNPSPFSVTLPSLFSLNYESHIHTQLQVKHLLYQEILKFHPSLAEEQHYSPPSTIFHISEIANPGFLTEQLKLPLPTPSDTNTVSDSPEDEMTPNLQLPTETPHAQTLFGPTSSPFQTPIRRNTITNQDHTPLPSQSSPSQSKSGKSSQNPLKMSTPSGYGGRKNSTSKSPIVSGRSTPNVAKSTKLPTYTPASHYDQTPDYISTPPLHNTAASTPTKRIASVRLSPLTRLRSDSPMSKQRSLSQSPLSTVRAPQRKASTPAPIQTSGTQKVSSKTNTTTTQQTRKKEKSVSSPYKTSLLRGKK
ncbi:putative Mitogen-activated protein kinase [Blattamonas nauphoetae]|uniref:Mitogen-activated protein kinase n=1 Tax=Blattamonas nauphoetae TaxID=2049346 RepID=A0ABQ9XGF6_9EUKA|nr:putative Mitogen-activated protein kinase [Blattamonas nauphoetae]